MESGKQIMIKNFNNYQESVAFEKQCQKIVTDHFRVPFERQVRIKIGDPPKAHKFNLVSHQRGTIIECKNYQWRKNGDPPNGKITELKSVVLYSLFVEFQCEKIIMMAKSTHPKRNETLAEYFVRLHGHLLHDTEVWEVDKETNTIEELR